MHVIRAVLPGMTRARMGRVPLVLLFLLVLSSCYSTVPEGFERSEMVTWDNDTRYRVEDLPDGFRVYVIYGHSILGSSERRMEQAGREKLMKIVREELAGQRREVRSFGEDDIKTVDASLEVNEHRWYGKLRVYWKP